MAEGTRVSESDIRETIRHYENFYEEVFLELAHHGELMELHVCDNLGDHMVGNVYAKFAREEDAENAARNMSGKYYSGRVITCEFSPVVEFDEARCRLYDEGHCDRGGYCNFMHIKHISHTFKKSLKHQMYYEHPEFKERMLLRKRQALAKEEKTHKADKEESDARQ
jgi:splicing factor U2AF subunit